MESNQRFNQSLSEAIEHLHADSGTIHVREPGRMVLRLVASQSIPEPVLAIVREVPWGKGMAGLAAERAQPVDACNLQTTTSPDVRPGARATGLQGALVVPMMKDGAVVGTLGVGCLTERAFDPTETEWLLGFARRLAQEIETP